MVSDVERDLRGLGVPDGVLFRHVEQLDKARAKRRAKKAKAPNAPSRRVSRSKVPMMAQRDRYPHE